MARSAVVLRRVLVRRVVAAADVAALETEAEVDPRISGREALLAAIRCVRPMVFGPAQVSAQRLRHEFSLRYAAGC